ncbi:hypothetical protein B0H19DRAFT_1375791 [Mycena capillaripes]|nr:hypothetical protein B0H19DRAFT_1375791 [Mycena capillaripes]
MRAFHKNEAILESLRRAKDGNGRLHLLALVRTELSEGKSVVDEITANYEKGRILQTGHRLIVFSKDGNTLFLFNHRSDRMREIVSTLGLPNPPREATIPKDLASRPWRATTRTFPSRLPFRLRG